jgi:hypothetical protein
LTMGSTLVGHFSLYDCHGERQHTLYLGEAPEYGSLFNYSFASRFGDTRANR